MSPFIKKGTVLFIRPVQAKKLQIGDLVCAYQEKFITHRLIKKKKSKNKVFYIAKGDASPLPDPPLKGSQILGKVTKIKAGQRVVDLESKSAKLKARFLASFSLLTFKCPKLANLIKKIVKLLLFRKFVLKYIYDY